MGLKSRTQARAHDQTWEFNLRHSSQGVREVKPSYTNPESHEQLKETQKLQFKISVTGTYIPGF